MGANREAIERFIAAMNAHDTDGIRACYAGDARILYPARDGRGPDEYVAGEREMLAAVPNYAIRATSILEAEGGHVVVELAMGGTQREDLGGRSFEMTGAYIFRLENGLITEERAYPDMAGLRKQLSPRQGA